MSILLEASYARFEEVHPADQLYPTVPFVLTHLFLLVNVVAMTSCSALVILRKYTEYAVVGLISVVILQALGYGLIFDINFFLRNLSVMGGLLMVLSDSWVRKRFAPAGLPDIEEKDRKMYFQLAGRVLLILLFAGFVLSGEWGFWRLLASLVGLVVCVMVVVGFKAKLSATLLVVILSIFNLVVNNFWTVSSLSRAPYWLHEAVTDESSSFTTSIQTRILPSTISSRFSRSCTYRNSLLATLITLTESFRGGLLLLVNMGPGAMSYDEKKKVY